MKRVLETDSRIHEEEISFSTKLLKDVHGTTPLANHHAFPDGRAHIGRETGCVLHTDALSGAVRAWRACVWVKDASKALPSTFCFGDC